MGKALVAAMMVLLFAAFAAAAFDNFALSISQKTFNVNKIGSGSCSDRNRLPDANAMGVSSGLRGPFYLTGAMGDQVPGFYINLGTNLLNLDYGDEISDGSIDYMNLTPSSTWGSRTSFTAVGYAPDGSLVITAANTTTDGSESLILIPSVPGKNFSRIVALTATSGTFGTAFAFGGSAGTFTGQGALEIGKYNDAGEVIWQRSGESGCYFRMAPSGITYDPGDGAQPLGFGSSADSGSSLAWGSIAYDGGNQLDIDGNYRKNERAFAFREDAGDGRHDIVRIYIQQEEETGAPYQFVDPISGGVMNTVPSKMYYSGTGAGPFSYDGLQSVGFVTERGTRFASMSRADASFSTPAVGVPTPTPIPARTPTPAPIPTLTPTETPAPTATAAPTETPGPAPSITPTPVQTATPLPTATRTPAHTATPAPTATPQKGAALPTLELLALAAVVVAVAAATAYLVLRKRK